VIRERTGSGDPVVLLHGMGSHAGVWRPVVPLLAERREVVTVDLPGFGDSPGGPADVPGIADALERELAEAGIERPHLVGNSMGGWVSLELARRGGARTVVALSPAGMWTTAEDVVSKLQLLSLYGASKLVSRFGEAPFRNPRVRAALMWIVRAHGERMSAAHAAQDTLALARSSNFMRMWRWTWGRNAEGLEEIDCPVQVAWGEREHLLRPAQGPRFVARIPGSELRVLQDLGHMPMSDDPHMVASTILDFQDAAVRRSRGAAAP
jgi:pimeloyl-ACP methyl ester carboxylesterase